jgi:PhzF family phenazine biosynthesis protein
MYPNNLITIKMEAKTLIPIYQVDAFTDSLFKGNPAAVCPLNKWLDDELMQNIAAENNLAETAFFVNKNGAFEIRWFTPEIEVDLCGHATLASAKVIFDFFNHTCDEIEFHSPRSGKLLVSRSGDTLTLNFPVDSLEKLAVYPLEILLGLKAEPKEVWKGKTDYICVFSYPEEVASMNPDFSQLAKIEARGVIVTAPGEKVDFVSRFFAPQSGIPEDPVTGSAHTSLAPYWAQKLGKSELSAMQLSMRQGFLKCKILGDRVEISGEAKVFMAGNLFINQ